MRCIAPPSIVKEKESRACCIGFRNGAMELLWETTSLNWIKKQLLLLFLLANSSHPNELPLFSREVVTHSAAARMCNLYQFFFLVNALHFHAFPPNAFNFSCHRSKFYSWIIWDAFRWKLSISSITRRKDGEIVGVIINYIWWQNASEFIFDYIPLSQSVKMTSGVDNILHYIVLNSMTGGWKYHCLKLQIQLGHRHSPHSNGAINYIDGIFKVSWETTAK